MASELHVGSGGRDRRRSGALLLFNRRRTCALLNVGGEFARLATRSVVWQTRDLSPGLAGIPHARVLREVS